LGRRQRVAERVTVVVAHPDDETLGMGAQLCRLDDGLLVHATDGAPRDGEDARNYGFPTPADYAAARRQELTAALQAGGADHLRQRCLDFADKQTPGDLAGLARRIADLLRDENPAVVFTHAYEGGHPDHDAVAFAVHAACRLFDEAPKIIEFPLYHRRDGRFVTGQFVNTSESRRRPGSIEPPTELLTNGSWPSPGPTKTKTRDRARPATQRICYSPGAGLPPPASSASSSASRLARAFSTMRQETIDTS
jgi:LmbE family N-acetylglucosaminyl deacetylase